MRKRAIQALLIGSAMACAALAASDQDWKRAETLYAQTSYTESLKILLADPERDGRTYELIGKNYFMLVDYKKACEALQKAVALEPDSSSHELWLARAYGRRAETGTPLLAGPNASKARQHFERAAALDPRNEEALADLFDFYLQAPGFLGGGLDKADALARRIGEVNPAEYHFAQAQLAESRRQYDRAEDHLRRAVALAPRQVGRVIDLAKYLAKHGRIQESDAAFQRAQTLAPDSPRVMFARAHSLIRSKRNLDEARALLEKYLQSDLTPDDPPRAEALQLLKEAGA